MLFGKNDTNHKQEEPEKLPLLTLDMITAGVRVYEEWNPEEDEVETLVICIYDAMMEAMKLNLKGKSIHSE